MKTVIAVIGCGNISNVHLPAFSQMDDVRIKYACDLIEEKALAAKEKYPMIEQVITDYHIALQDPEVEAVWILTPNFAHYTISMDVLRAGKHAFCEKPITVDYEKSCEMAEEAHRQNKMLNIGVCNRYHRSVEKLKEMNDKGEFGNLYHVYCAFRGCRSIPGLGGPFTTKSQSGGGVLIDWGVHFFDLILYILGDVKLETLTCDTYSEMAKDMKSYRCRNMWSAYTADIEHGTNDVEDFISGYIRTNKASICFNGAWAQNLDIDEMYVDFLGDKKGARLTYRELFDLFDGETLETTREEYEIPDMYFCEDRAFLESIRTGVKSRSHIDYVLQSAKLMDILYASSEKKQEIDLR